MTPEETLDWLAQQHFDQCREERPIQDWIRKMKSQLPKQEQGEPVAWMDDEELRVVTSKQKAGMHESLQKSFHKPLYTTPQQPSTIVRKPLTEKQIEESLADMSALQMPFNKLIPAIARAIEAAHGITASEAEDSARSKTC